MSEQTVNDTVPKHIYNTLLSRCIDADVEIEKLQKAISLYEAMKEGVAIRISDLENENNRLNKLLDCRAGKLLRKGKTFIVVAVDEPYFIDVFFLIRNNERDHGRWTAADELWFQRAITESFEIEDTQKKEKINV